MTLPMWHSLSTPKQRRRLNLIKTEKKRKQLTLKQWKKVTIYGIPCFVFLQQTSKDFYIIVIRSSLFKFMYTFVDLMQYHKHDLLVFVSSAFVYLCYMFHIWWIKFLKKNQQLAIGWMISEDFNDFLKCFTGSLTLKFMFSCFIHFRFGGHIG